MLKPELLEIMEEFFSIGWNHETSKLIAVRNKLLEFIKENEYFLVIDGEYDDNFIIAKDIIRLIDAFNVYASTNSRHDAYRHMNPFFERVKQSLSQLNYYDLEILVHSIEYVLGSDEAHDLAMIAHGKLVEFRTSRNTNNLEGTLATNMCSILLHAKYSKYEIKVDLAEKFEYWFNRLKELSEKTKYLELLFLLTQIRQAIFYKKQANIDKFYQQLKMSCDEQTVILIANEIEFYEKSENVST